MDTAKVNNEMKEDNQDPNLAAASLTATMQSLLKPNNGDGFISQKALKMMEKMGYVQGAGLGKQNQGRLEPVPTLSESNRRGLGLQIPLLNALTSWDTSIETVDVKENIKWISSTQSTSNLQLNFIKTWIKEGERKLTVYDETHFCDSTILKNVLKSKELLDLLDPVELCRARSRANPFESIRGVFFLNRAAIKMANIDAACGFLFTNIENDTKHSCSDKPYYFADVCAGPGGFSEYILWRKQWLYKGFGFTLRGENDFRLSEFYAAPTETFQPLYGVQGNGNIYDPSNISDFREKVMFQTDELGVHFMMSDGGFSVEGQENLQEILSKQIYLCQCLVALSIVRTNGHFVTKLFDTFTLFTVGLIYYMYRCFEEISIFKPNSSRPANSERYLICKYKKNDTESVRQILEIINERLWTLGSDSELDIHSIVPAEVLETDKIFFNYIAEVNNTLAERQVVNLMKIMVFSKNHSLIETRQTDVRKECLLLWNLPDKPRVATVKQTPNEIISQSLPRTDFLFAPSVTIPNDADLIQYITKPDEWYFIVLSKNPKRNSYHFYLGLGGSKVYMLENQQWMLTSLNLELPRCTLIYGEQVTEYHVTKTKKPRRVVALHVIDACYLGRRNVASKNYSERIRLINIFCRSIHQPYRNNLVRIRAKLIMSLKNIKCFEDLYSLIPKKDSEYYLPNLLEQKPYILATSLLFMHGKDGESFQETFKKRLWWDLPSSNADSSSKDRTKWSNALKFFDK